MQDPEDLDLTVRQNHHDVALAKGQQQPCLVCHVNEKKGEKKKEKKALLAAALEIPVLEILAHLCKGRGAGSRSRQLA